MQINSLGEWTYYGHLLLKMKPDATLWDLLRVMYTVKTKNEFPIDEPDDTLNVIVDRHLKGWSAMLIGIETGINADYIYTYLISMGFIPWRDSGTVSITAAIELILHLRHHKCDENVIRDAVLDAGTSKYMYNRINKELDNAKSAGFR